MADIVLRNVDDELVKRVRMRAVETGLKFREFVCNILLGALDDQANVLAGPERNDSAHTDSVLSSGNSTELVEADRMETGLRASNAALGGVDSARHTEAPIRYSALYRDASSDAEDVAEEEVDPGPLCPECLEPLVRNKQMPILECKCGHRQKVKA